MFSAPLNRLKFNRPYKASWDMFVTAIFAEQMNAYSNVGKDVSLSVTLRESCYFSAYVSRGVPAAHTYEEQLSAQGVVAAQSPVQSTLTAALAGASALVKNMGVTEHFSDRMEGTARLVKNMLVAAALTNALSGSTSLSKDMVCFSDNIALLQAIVILETPFTQRVWLPVQIPPGSTLTLDSEHLRLLLDGQNILHLHNGHWPELMRETLRMEIDCGTGKLQGVLSYTPAFL